MVDIIFFEKDKRQEFRSLKTQLERIVYVMEKKRDSLYAVFQDILTYMDDRQLTEKDAYIQHYFKKIYQEITFNGKEKNPYNIITSTILEEAFRKLDGVILVGSEERIKALQVLSFEWFFGRLKTQEKGSTRKESCKFLP